MQLLACRIEAARPADARGHVAEQILDQRAQMRLDLAVEEVDAHQADAAVDVVADAAGRNDAAFVRIGGADAADAEAVAPVDVRHGQAGDAGCPARTRRWRPARGPGPA